MVLQMEHLEHVADEFADSEEMNRVLTKKAQETNVVVDEARTRLIRVFQRVISSTRTIVRIKRMGEVDVKAFIGPCKRKFGANGPTKAADVSSLWQENLKDPNWFPLVFTTHDGWLQEMVDEEDEKMKSLKEEWGDEAQKAVVVALKELSEYSPRERCIVNELWNFKAKRKATIKEANNCVLRSLNKQLKRNTST